MIFSRRRKAADDETPEVPAEPAAEAEVPAEPAPAEDGGEETGEGGERDWAAFDRSRDWRADGPFDISEVDLDADDVQRIDLGSLVITPREGMELRLQVAQDTGAVVSAMVLIGQSALELAVFAAPRSGGLWAEIREEVVAATRAQKGTVTLVEGPYGTELRRLVPVTGPEGQQGYQPSRTWAAEGPRWLLRGVLYGQAALAQGLASPADELHDVFASTVVRRGDTAMAAGEVIPMTVPDDVAIRPAPGSQPPAARG
ncbi:DUF3710 domain-containing protein [Auraticoccus sp. F435]|uniref:DUF3710 domain-containing protein n=1 Tax=Auraticoccus cholistanensis TaxID=2656650 RepID=A0A6A9V0P2_9ACTN|nr:DUF3710 domain-containing protein [Auraticoccus cholistanensis]MVA75730.1 DUF3710 domain-containing protein [Auraticoccus cholistanensis]